METTLLVLPLTFPFISCFERELPTSFSPTVKKFYMATSVGPYYDVEQDLRADHYIRQKNLLEIENIERRLTYKRESHNLDKGDDTYKKDAYVKIVKHPSKTKTRTLADWFLFYKGVPISLFAICMLGLPILFAGFLQMMITAKRIQKMRISRRTWEFPLVPVLMLQQTRREYLLRKKTVRRFCIQWEVGRINIRMHTRLVDLRQILHPPTKRKKAHKYTTWRIIRLICRFNAFLAMRKRAKQRSQEQLKVLQKARAQTWKNKIESSRYLLEKKFFDETQDSDTTGGELSVHHPKPKNPHAKHPKHKPETGHKGGKVHHKKHHPNKRPNNKVAPHKVIGKKKE